MRVTFEFDDALVQALEAWAARCDLSVSEVVARALSSYLGPDVDPSGLLPPLPVFDCGKLLVDFSDRNELYEVLGRERDQRMVDPQSSRETDKRQG